MAAAPAADIVIGIPPLIQLIATSYLAVKRHIEHYRNYDDSVEDILRRVDLAEKMFELHIRKLLTEIIGEENTELLLKPPENNSGSNNDIDAQISTGLGRHGQAVYKCIEQAHSILKRIEEMEFSGEPLVACDETQPVVGRNVARTQHVLDRLLRKKVKKKIPRMHTVERIFGEQRKKLVALLQALQEENNHLQGFLFHQMVQNIDEIRQSSRETPPALTRSATLAQPSSPEVGQSLFNAPYSILDSEVLSSNRGTREASKILYNTLLQLPPCSCHFVYLCLETSSSPGTSQHNSSAEAVVRQSGITFSVLVASKGSDDSQTIDCSESMQHNTCQEVLLEIVQTYPPVDPDINHPPPCPGLCGTLFVDRHEHEYALENFHVQLVQNRQEFAREEPPPAAITLRELLKDENRIMTYERLLLAAKLGDAAFAFHSSPWMEFWRATTITYLAAYESSEQPASWTPHIANPLTSDRRTMLNDGMYRLGMILLEIGGITQGQLDEIEKPTNNEKLSEQTVLAMKKDLLKVALCRVTRQMGSAFKKAAEQCFINHGPVSDEEVMKWFQTMQKLEALAYDCYRDDA